jgi:hypothetical protein
MEAVDALSEEGDAGDEGEEGLVLGDRRITYAGGKWKAMSYDLA